MNGATPTKRILQGLTLVVLLALTPMAGAQAPDYRPVVAMDDRTDIHRSWVCAYVRESDDVLYLRCDDLARLLDDSAARDSAGRAGPTQYIPVWTRPRSAAAAADLARRVLCDEAELCQVEMAAAAGRQRVARF